MSREGDMQEVNRNVRLRPVLEALNLLDSLGQAMASSGLTPSPVLW